MNNDEFERGLTGALHSGLSDSGLRSALGVRNFAENGPGMAVMQAAAPVTPIDAAHSAFSATRRLAERIGALRDKLVGSSPESAGTASKPGYGGVLGDLRSHAEQVTEALAAADAALAAIERNLP